MLANLQKVVGLSIRIAAVLGLLLVATKLWDNGPGWDNHFRETIRHQNETLPKMMDGITRADSITTAGRTVTYRATIMREIPFDALRERQEETLRWAYCDQMAPLAQKGWSAVWSYKLSDGRFLGAITINPSSCS